MAATCKSYGTSPPSSRLPPDGHEFPGDYLDDTSHGKMTGRGRSGSGGNAGWRASRDGRDERSERSVKDKIALFTNDAKPTTTSTASVLRHHLPVSTAIHKNKYPTLSCSVDNLSVGRSPMISPVIRPEASRTLPRHPLATPAGQIGKASGSVDATANLSERSRSMLDVAHYSPPGSHGQQRKSSLISLASESGRRKSSLLSSSSKLRGLVIPDIVDGGVRQSGTEKTNRPVIIDLPEIISKDSVMVVGLAPLGPLRSPNGTVPSSPGNEGGHDVTDHAQQQPKSTSATITSLSSLPWKSNSPNLPKYSPAFKRKELTVLRAPYNNSPPESTTANPAPVVAETYSGGTKTQLLSSFSCPSESHGITTTSPVAEENAASDTDGDSAVSSSRSSFSPSGSPIPDRNANHHNHHDNHQVVDDDETTNLTIAGRVLKAQSVEALNRKNVLQSAKYSSGGSVMAVGAHLDLRPPTSTPSLPNINPSTDHHKPTAVDTSIPPFRPSGQQQQRNNKGTGGDFEQTLRKFSSAEASSRIERSAPRLRLSSSERLETKAAFITDVCDTSPIPSSPASIKSTSPIFQRESPLSKKFSTGSTTTASASKEIKSFRALAERWEAIASEAPPTPSGSSPPTNSNSSAFVTKRTELQNEERVPPSNQNTLTKTTATTTAPPPPTTTTTSTSARPVTSRSVSAGVVEIRKAFERVKEELETESNCNYGVGVGREGAGASLDDYKQHHSLFSLQQHQHGRMSSLDSTTSEDSSLPFGYGYGYGGVGFGCGVGGVGYGGYYGGPFGIGGIGVRDNYGSITSLASSTSLISPQELQQLLDEANQSLEESGTPSHEIVVVVLHRGGDVASTLSPGLGITLAGGADYETKEITIHKVIGGSVADRDGRIQKGDRVLSINGKGLKGVTHREALAILKAPRPEVVLVLSRNRSVSPQDCHDVDKDLLLPSVMIPVSNTGLVGYPSRSNHLLLSSSGGTGLSRPPRILESPSDFTHFDHGNEEDLPHRGPPLQTTLVKDGAGLGFSLEGGKDSPLGDRPLTIKKIFTGGAASKNSTLRVGDQIISVNGCDVTSMSRIEAWNLMKKLPDGAVSLIIRQQIMTSS